jgi:two-component system response regulator
VRVLLVEDNPTDVELTRLALEDAGIAEGLSVVTDGHEALAFLRGQAPFTGVAPVDVVLLDMHLPRLDGHEVLREIRKDPALRNTVVAVLTAEGMPIDGELDADAQGSKPLDPQQVSGLLALVRERDDATA